MVVETWVSNKGLEEVHHFADNHANVYLFGFNRKLLGPDLYDKVRALVQDRLIELGQDQGPSLCGMSFGPND